MRRLIEILTRSFIRKEDEKTTDFIDILTNHQKFINELDEWKQSVEHRISELEHEFTKLQNSMNATAKPVPVKKLGRPKKAKP